MYFRHQCRYSSVLLLLILCFWQTHAGAQSGAGDRQPVSPVSTIEIPIRLSLDPLASAAESTLPQQAGNWRSWKDWHGIQTRYRAWRGPLRITAWGDTLLVQAHIRYWIRARKKVLGAINLKSSCGVNEPPRQALIGMQVRLGWGADWTLRPGFRILPTRFLDRCEMTVANIDVTPLVEKEFRKEMQESLREALKTLAPGMGTVRTQARRIWSLLQEPVELGASHWFMFRPVGVALSGIRGQGNFIDAHLAVKMQPALAAGEKPAVEPTPLPPLERYVPGSSGLNLRLSMNLGFADLNRRLSSTLSGQYLDIQGRQAGMEMFVLEGTGQEIRARAKLVGDVAGSVHLRARPVYDPKKRYLQLQNLTFEYEAENPAIALLEESFHEYIRQALEAAANQALTRYLALLGDRLAPALERILPEGVTLDMSALQPGHLNINVMQQGIRLEGAATGRVRLVLH